MHYSTPRALVKTYVGLATSSVLFLVAAVILYVLAVLVLVVDLIAAANAGNGPAGSLAIAKLPLTIMAAIMTAVVGLLMHGLSAGLDALRDIAINSWQ